MKAYTHTNPKNEKASPHQGKQQSQNTHILQAYKQTNMPFASTSKPGEQPVQKKANNTGLPDQLKAGVENLSGYSLDDVNVHYNSSQPATLQAHAYAQGTDIHVAPGQEKHLPHEAWHVVQQKQGRVKPTMQMKGSVPVNDDTGLEKEADVMGAKAMQLKTISNSSLLIHNSIPKTTAQLESASYRNQNGTQTDVNWETATLGESKVGTKMAATNLTRESLGKVTNLVGSGPESGEQESLMSYLPTNPSLSSVNKYIRGHLLNHNIGGPGKGFNMYPITASANSAHLKWVERDVKKWVENGKTIDYSVAVSQSGTALGTKGAKAGSVTASFVCSAKNIDDNKTISETIPSTIGTKSIPPSMKDEDFD